MFRVTCTYPLDERWESLDKAVYDAAGRRSDAAGAMKGVRDHLWSVPTFEEALAMRRALSKIKGVKATFGEV